MVAEPCTRRGIILNRALPLQGHHIYRVRPLPGPELQEKNIMNYVLFDIDGTLWDAVPQMHASWNAVLESRPESAGRTLSLQEVYSLMGHTGEEIAAYTLPRLPEELRMDIMSEAFAREHEDLKTIPGTFYPGVGETMRQLSAAGYGIGIISNCQDGYIGIMLSHGGFRDFVIDSECSGRTGMPKGDNIRLLLERNHVSADDAVYVGDTSMDEAASRAAGVRFVFASYGFGKASCPDAVIRSISELPDILTGLFGGGLLGKSSAEFTSLLASPSSVPGGGGASALAGAIGAALGDMVGELTLGKKKYKDVEDEIREAMTAARALRVRLLSCVEKDAAAFEPLSRAYGIPKDDPDRERVMEACLKDAAAVPAEIFDLCCEAIEIQKIFAEKGSRLMISDAATGAALCRGALYGAAINVRVNTRLMKDRDYAEQLDRHIREKLVIYSSLAQEIYTGVEQKLS